MVFAANRTEYDYRGPQPRNLESCMKLNDCLGDLALFEHDR
jgi:hypothetical protein